MVDLGCAYGENGRIEGVDGSDDSVEVGDESGQRDQVLTHANTQHIRLAHVVVYNMHHLALHHYCCCVCLDKGDISTGEQ